jgi:hypothetical protein
MNTYVEPGEWHDTKKCPGGQNITVYSICERLARRMGDWRRDIRLVSIVSLWLNLAFQKQ